MCEMHEYRFSVCGCGPIYGPRHFSHSDCCSPIFPSKKAQVGRLKDYKKMLQDRLNEIENRLKDLE